jgi:hypothetical protein
MKNPAMIAALLILSLVIGGVATQYPEIKRYLKIRSM